MRAGDGREKNKKNDGKRNLRMEDRVVTWAWGWAPRIGLRVFSFPSLQAFKLQYEFQLCFDCILNTDY